MNKILTFSAALLLLASCQQQEQIDKTLYSDVKSVNKIVLGQMSISKMATISDLNLGNAQGAKQMLAALGDQVKVGSRKAAYSYNTYLRAYMSFNDFTPDDIEVDEMGKTITVTLPAIQTEFQGRDMELKEEHYRVSGLRSNIDPAERAKVKELMNASLKKEVEEKSVFKEKLVAKATEKANAYFTSLLARDGYTVVVKIKN